MRKVPVEEQIQWVLSYVQRGAADVWEENMLEARMVKSKRKLYRSNMKRES